jgi:hypothetical protein
MSETMKDWATVSMVTISAAAILLCGLVTIDQRRTPTEMRRLFDEISAAKRIAKGKVDSGWATQRGVQWSWLNDIYNINLVLTVSRSRL